MIWTRQRLLADHELVISIFDRTFEHGLGLFETFRTWEGHAPFVEQHNQRLLRSAEELRLSLNPDALPNAADVRALLDAEGGAGDRLLRVTLSGGTLTKQPGVLWMRTSSVPPALPAAAHVGGFWQVDRQDPLARHKSLNYWRRRIAHEEASAAGFDEWLSRSADGAIWEGSRTNLFVVIDSVLCTPTDAGPIVPGVFRTWVIAQAPKLGIEVREAELNVESLDRATEVFLTNSVRGMIPVAQILGRSPGASGPVTQALQTTFQSWRTTRGRE
jgi:branched-subunit amino acid aminotransferase/4-amino-4-deoxychorismate lyase